ncbi:bifunctional endoribonuclease/protein kinase ire1 [Cladophialophora chaetospira]|uniref:non-specific serine/threonine protein kinase n=1 Tax=Cladophialophora chaetospira TaxID=386627 RepID=A0AA38X3R5_9EURO|nr:bifunctional endoribonuclease/protein kinase ire1 [Cladophialophora chaetospira]
MAKPPLRLPGRGGGRPMLTWALLLLLLAAAQSQSQSVHLSEVPHRLVASTQSLRAEPSRRPTQAGRSPAEIPLRNNDITTIKFRPNNEDYEDLNINKLRALAPAYNSLSSSAVRAPLVQQSVESQGLSALPSARLLQDWEVENIVLLATVDGTIHARDRKTGNERWSLGIPNSPMIETIHHKLNRSDLEMDGSQYDDDYMFIVEPSKDGNLYVQSRDPRIGLQRLGVTVRSLAAETPQFVDNPPIVTISSQETTAYVVDAATGTILQQFDKYRGFSGDDQSRSCRRLSGFELDDPACDPIGTINLGRIEYTIQISHKITNQPLCTIKFAEWLPNKMDSDLQQQYVAPLDNYYIQSYYNGRIIGIDETEAGKIPRFTQMFDTPVARVFDVVRPLDNHDESAKLVLLSRPTDSPLLPSAEVWRNEMQRAERVFVNKTEAGVWYAMSELSYPGVTSGAAPANSNWNYDALPLDFDGNLEEIVGVHVLSGLENTTPVRLTISGPPPVTDLAEEADKAMASLESKIPPALLPVISHPLMSFFNIICVSIFIFVVGLQMRSPAMVKLQRLLRKAGVEVAVEKVRAQPAGPTSSTPEEQEVPVADVSGEKDVTGVVSEVLENALTTPARSRAQSMAASVASPVKTARIVDPNGDSSEGESEDEKYQPESNSNGANVAEGEAQPGRKHAKRGKRGGRRNKKGKKTMDPEVMDEKEQLVAEVPTKDGLLQVGKLRIDAKEDRCLGRGSNGTAVFPGSLDGREVAVKRLIRTPNSLAAKEIKHLLSSDTNAHVIRYFGKEESQHFTYIALERFTTSLDQFIERPLLYPELVKLPEGFDVKDALRQITDGVQHLHSLKLVHRDIKPQNVLVRAVKNNRPTTGLPKLQFVISDFGLCKRLEEGPESAFAPTANHTAAGTTGWRAPELLVGSRSAVAAPNVNSNSASKSNTHSSETTVIDPPSGRRATKAIDIFSLGCVYYYIMTQGHHPFDVGGTSLGRDLNIKEDKFSTDDLRLHNYQFDADDLIMQMLKHDPKERPTTDQILRHPYFWEVADKLEFLCGVSDCYEREKNSINNIHDENAVRSPAEKESLALLAGLESLAPNVIGQSKDWLRALPKTFLTEMGKQRKYSGTKMIDLLRVIRNKKNHFHDLPEDVKEQMLGGSAKGYYEFWAKRFPSLLINCHCLVLERRLVGRFRMERWFE